MKYFKYYLISCFGSLALMMFIFLGMTSCDVYSDIDIEIPDTEAVIGTYYGHYGFGNETPENALRYRIKAGGVFQEIGLNSGSVVGQGTWQLYGNILTAKYTSIFSPHNKYSIRATFNSQNSSLKGTWGGEYDDSDGGKIVMYQD